MVGRTRDSTALSVMGCKSHLETLLAYHGGGDIMLTTGAGIATPAINKGGSAEMLRVVLRAVLTGVRAGSDSFSELVLFGSLFCELSIRECSVLC